MYELRKEYKHWMTDSWVCTSAILVELKKTVHDAAVTRNQTTATGFTLQSSVLAAKPQSPTDRSMQTKHHK